jgi:AraC family transcriptional regulator of adaptative response/methylated-DNA-[protein]-cysteine methyltransferase
MGIADRLRVKAWPGQAKPERRDRATRLRKKRIARRARSDRLTGMTAQAPAPPLPQPDPGSHGLGDLAEQARHYEVVARAITWLRARTHEQPSLEDVAAAVHLSPSHLQRVFSRWVGLSPKRFLQFLTHEQAKARLRGSSPDAHTLAVAADVGLSGPGRLHALMVTCEAVTPAQWRSFGEGLAIGWGFGPTPFGLALIAWTDRGVCHLAFATGPQASLLRELEQSWPRAVLSRDDAAAASWLTRVFAQWPEPGPLHLIVRGTNFQIRVWQALLHTQPGDVLTYGELARRIGAPRAARAVGSALAANEIGWLIPCHRVVRDGGEVGQYRWQPERKVAMLGWEAQQREPA